MYSCYATVRVALLRSPYLQSPGAWDGRLVEFDPPGISIRARIDLVGDFREDILVLVQIQYRNANYSC